MEASDEYNYVSAVEMKIVSAHTLDSFNEKVKELINNGEEISCIVAVVATMKLLSPLQ